MPYVPGDPDFRVHRIVEGDPSLPDVLVEIESGQRFTLDWRYAGSISIAPTQVRS